MATGVSSASTIAGRLARAAGRFLLPSVCLVCARAPLREFFQGGLCADCWEAMPAPAKTRCELCDEALACEGAEFCGRCLLHPPEFRTLRAAAPYRGPARAALLAAKFRGADYLIPHFARLMAARLTAPPEIGEVVSVPPLARERLRRDHVAETLARAVARELDLPFAGRRLVKARATRRQSGLPLEERAGNVRGAFTCAARPPKAVLLVDDIATSSSTARSCAGALRRSGAETVDVWCFARASREDELDSIEQAAGGPGANSP